MISVEKLHVRQGEFSLSDISFKLPEGAYGILVGRSGCGKTTLLEAVCGLRPITGGKILLGTKDVTALKPGERGVGYVPQDGALFPHL
ncbi:MAG: ATP-binding cassette domain-containing protein, partial [Opitutales bacterium]